MRGGRSRLPFIVLLCSFLSVSAARADTPPSVWDFAKDPRERDLWALHVRIERLLHPPGSPDALPGELRREGELRLEAAKAMLEEADAAHSPDVRLRFDLGNVYEELATLQHRNDLQSKVIDVLAPALDRAPDHPAATQALESLVYAYAKMDRPREELATWRRLIPRLDDERARATPMMNMGEAEMRLGLVDEALATFREVLRICGDVPNTAQVGSTYVLTLWDLAVALDRTGDPGTALDAMEAAGKASRMTVIGSGGMQMTGGSLIAHDPEVFFVPDWEREWYLALQASVEARDAKDVRDAAANWMQAERHWDSYIEHAAKDGGRERFLAIARVRRSQAHTQRLATERAASRLPNRASVHRVGP